MNDGTPGTQPLTGTRPDKVPQFPARQLLLALGEAVLLLIGGGVLFIVISRIGGARLLGEYALVLAWITLFQGIAGFGIPEFIMREMGIHGTAGARNLFHGLIICIATSLAAMAAMLLLIGFFDYESDLKVAMRIGALALMPMMIAYICRAGFLARRQMGWVFVIALVESVTVMTVSTWLVLHDHGVVSLVATLCGAKLLSSLLALYWFNRHGLSLDQRFDWTFFKTQLGPIFAFGMGNVLGMVALRVNTIMLSFWATMSAVGHYAAAAKILDVALILPSLGVQLMMPRVASAFARQSDYELAAVDKAFHALFTATMPLGIGVIFYADTIVTTLFGPEFINAVLPLRLLMIYFLVEVADALMSVVLKSAHRQNTDARLFAFNPATNILLNLLAIPALGGAGAALGKVAGVLVSSFARLTVISRDLVKLRWMHYVARPLMVSLVAGSVLVPLHQILPGLLSGVLYLALCGTGVALTARFSWADIGDFMRRPRE